MSSRGKGGLVVKLVAELRPAETTETEIAQIERNEAASLAELGLRLEEAANNEHGAKAVAA